MTCMICMGLATREKTVISFIEVKVMQVIQVMQAPK
jgi:hypothetical protein